jgi:hypothetical protein
MKLSMVIIGSSGVVVPLDHLGMYAVVVSCCACVVIQCIVCSYSVMCMHTVMSFIIICIYCVALCMHTVMACMHGLLL